MISDGTLQEFECAIASDKHFLNQAIDLSCGHHICKQCVPAIDSKNLRCNICKQINTKDLTNSIENVFFKIAFQKSIQDLFHVLENSFVKSFCDFKDALSKNIASLKIQYIKEEVEIRVESIKLQLDNINDAFQFKLDEISKEINKNKLEKIDQTQNEYEANLNELRSYIQNYALIKDKTKNEEQFYEYQEKLKHLNSILKSLESDGYDMKFEVSQEILKPEIIGKLMNGNEVLKIEIISPTKNLNSNIIDIKELCQKANAKRYKSINLDVRTWCIYKLPNNTILTSSYYNLSVYDENFKLLKRLDLIDAKKFYCDDLAISDSGFIYFGDHLNKRFIMTDLELKVIISRSNDAYSPQGSAIYNDRLYICDFSTNAILVFHQDLTFEKTIKLEYKPFQIKILKNTAAIRPFVSFKTLYFYDVRTFQVIQKYEGHNGTLTIINSNLYEYYHKTGTIYCYDDEGKLLEEGNIQIDDLRNSFFSGALLQYQDKIIIACDRPEKLFIF